jgi:hypothetical protein
MLRILLVISIFFLVSCNSNPEEQLPAQQTQAVSTPEPVSPPTDVTETAPPTDRVRDAQQRLRDRDQAQNPEPSDEPRRYRLEIAPFNSFNDADGYFDITGASLQEVQRVLGEPPVLVRQGREGAPMRREVRVYFPYEEDSTGLYLYFVNETVESFRLDTFLGLANSDVMDFFR